MKNKHVGLLIIAISIVFLLLVFSFNNTLEKITNESCMHGESCPMYATLDIQKAISYSLIAILILVGAAITFFVKDKIPVINPVSREHVTKVVKAAVAETAKSQSLSVEQGLTESKKQQLLESTVGEEQQIIQLLINKEGSVYQSDLVKGLDITKVKVTRLLDKLEGKGLIERKRRGMTNIVVLKY